MCQTTCNSLTSAANVVCCGKMPMMNAQSEFKNEVKQWLKSHKLDYRWMAERCGVSEITVRNWMSQKNIPPLKQQLLERIMVQMPTAGANDAGQSIPGVSVNASMSLTVQLAPELYRRLTERALAENITPEALIAKAISDLVSADSKPALRTREVMLPTQK